MSREFKISNIHQADDAINTVNERMRATTKQLQRQIEDTRTRMAADAQRRAEAQAAKVRSELNSRLNREVAGMNDNLRQVDLNLRNRLQSVANDLTKAIETNDRQLRDDMRRMDTRIKNEISSLEGRTRKRFEEVDRRLSNLKSQIEAGLLAQQKQLDSHQRRLDSHDQQLASLTDAVNGILRRLADTEQRRREAVKLATGLRDAAFARTPIARFCPAEARQIDDRIQALLNNPDDEATAARAAEAILQIQFAEEEALRRSMIYDAMHRQAVEVLETVLGEVNANRTNSVSYPDDPAATAEIETDFWSRGEYSRICERLNQLKREIESQPDSERLRAILNEVAECEVQANHLVDEAARKAILSENRVAITEDIVDALLQQGWQIERKSDGTDSIGYLGGDIDSDWREGVYAVISSMNGERISLVVRPDENELENQIIFHRNDERNITDLDYRRSLQRIKEQISRSGHTLGDIQVPVGGGDTKVPALTDTASLGRKGTARKINESVRSRR